MAAIDSFANMECIISGHRFVGWAAEDPPFEFDYEDAVDDRNSDRTAHCTQWGCLSLGGTWTFKMFPDRRLPRNGQCSRNRLRKDNHMSGGEPFRFYNWRNIPAFHRHVVPIGRRRDRAVPGGGDTWRYLRGDDPV